jgi:hypothetical protein
MEILGELLVQQMLLFCLSLYYVLLLVVYCTIVSYQAFICFVCIAFGTYRTTSSSSTTTTSKKPDFNDEPVAEE